MFKLFFLFLLSHEDFKVVLGEVAYRVLWSTQVTYPPGITSQRVYHTHITPPHNTMPVSVRIT